VLEELRLRHSDSFAEQVRRYPGVKRFHAHEVRHSFACGWLKAGGSLAALQEILGHASIVTTQRYRRLSEAHVLAGPAGSVAGVTSGGRAKLHTGA